MKRTGADHEWIGPVIRGVGAVMLVVSVTRPVASSGLGSALALHELFDLFLAGRLPFGMPRWLGVFGYLPAVGGGLVLVGEAFVGRWGLALRTVGVVLATGAVAALAFGGPWSAPAEFGPGLWWGIAGSVLVILGSVGGVVRGWLRREATEPGGSGGPAVAEPRESVRGTTVTTMEGAR